MEEGRGVGWCLVEHRPSNPSESAPAKYQLGLPKLLHQRTLLLAFHKRKLHNIQTKSRPPLYITSSVRNIVSSDRDNISSARFMSMHTYRICFRKKKISGFFSCKRKTFSGQRVRNV